MTFEELGLSEKTIQAINEAGITAPTTVQADVIPSILAGKDVFAIAPSGCGKTYSYIFPLIEIISQHAVKNILIITAGSRQSVAVSDRFAVFNKYHEINQTALTDSEDDISKEANVIIASPNQLVDIIDEDRADFSDVNILVIDDINLIKRFHQLKNLEKILAVLPASKQNIIFTNRRSKETQDILDKVLQTPEEIKINRDCEQEALQPESGEAKSVSEAEQQPAKTAEAQTEDARHGSRRKENRRQSAESAKDSEALSLMRKFHTFGRHTPEFMLTRVELADDD